MRIVFLLTILLFGCQPAYNDFDTEISPEKQEALEYSRKLEKNSWQRGEYVDEMTDVRTISSRIKSINISNLPSPATLRVSRICPHSGMKIDDINVSIHWPARSSTIRSDYSYIAYPTIRFGDEDAISPSLGSNFEGTFFTDNYKTELLQGILSTDRVRVRTVDTLESDFQSAEFLITGISGEIEYLNTSCPPDPDAP